MSILLRTAALALAGFVAAPAHATEKSDFALLHAFSLVQENRIVGLWESRVDLGPCNNAPGTRRQFRGLNAFNLGGTMTDTNAAGPATRGPGFGAWVYDRREKTYRIRMQFYRYLPDGSFDGLTDIHREATLAVDGKTFSDVIYARLLNPDDSLRLEMCGTASATRVDPE